MHGRMRFALVACAGLSIAGALAACSDTNLANFQNSVGNFVKGVNTVDAAIATISAPLYANCNSIAAVAQAASDIAGSCSKASPVFTAANAAVGSMCQASQVTNISSTVIAAAASFTAVKTQLAMAKASCAAGAS